MTIQDGTKLHTRSNGPQGIWGTPPIPAEDRLVKMRDCLSRRLPNEKTEQPLDVAGVRAMVSLAG